MFLLKAIGITVLAWIVGMATEIYFGLPYGQHVVFPVIAMGACVLYALSENEKKLYDIRKLLKGQEDEAADEEEEL